MRKEKLAQDATLKREDERAMINKVLYVLRLFKDCQARERAKRRPCFAIYGQKAGNAGSTPCGVISCAGASAVAGPEFPSQIPLF